MLIEIDPDDVEVISADSRGRVTLGSEYADDDVEIAVLSVNPEYDS